MSSDNLLAIVFNVYEWGEGLHLPAAYIVKKDRQGLLTHVVQRATTETAKALNIPIAPHTARMLLLEEQLQPLALENRFNTNKKKKRSLQELIEEEEVKTAIVKYAHRLLDNLFQLIQQHKAYLAWNLERRVLVKDFLVQIAAQPLEPLLWFKRTEEGVHYKLRGRQGDKVVVFSNFKEVSPLTNQPAWIYADYQLFKVLHINGNMVKPFRQKDEVLIPPASVAAYFRKFILKVVSQTDIEAEGFDIVQHTQLEHCVLEPVKHLFSDKWVISVQMVYPNARFDWRDRHEKRTTLEMDGDQLSLMQIRRNYDEEAARLELLKSLGLKGPEQEGSYFEPAEQLSDDAWFVLHWLANHRQTLEKAGFEVLAPEWEGQKVYLHQAHLELKAEQANDWFDLHGEVRVGEFTIPFMALARYIKEENRFYPLPNGEIFLIPEEWMARYQQVAQFAKKEEGHLKLTKSQYTLLNELDITHQGVVEAQAIDYNPPATLKATLRPYQLEGVRWLIGHYHNELGACLADDMGLGKTLQTIALLLHAKALRPAAAQAAPQLDLFSQVADHEILQPLQALLIMPASLIYNWEREIKRFAPSLSVCVHTGARRQTDTRILARYDVLLTTYQTALRDEAILGKLAFEYVVLDESQQIKNRDSKIFKSVNTLQSRHKLSLSGTPIENSLGDLWSQMQFINPDLLGSFSFFKEQFMAPIEKHADEAAKKRLRSLVQPYLLRRTKEEVAPDLPPLTTQLFYSEMTPEQTKRYEREKSAARNLLLDNFQGDNPQFKFQVLQSLTRLRQIANHPVLANADFDGESGKFFDVLEQWDVVRKSGHKVLVFSSFVQYLELFKSHFDKERCSYAWLTGDLDAKQRVAAIEKFENDPSTQSFLISIKAGGAGLNLTAADYVFILDPWWNPAAEQQAIARAHRIGQSKHVFATKFIAKDSIEEKILVLQERKAQLAEDIIGDTGKLSWSKDELAFLLA